MCESLVCSKLGPNPTNRAKVERWEVETVRENGRRRKRGNAEEETILQTLS